MATVVADVRNIAPELRDLVAVPDAEVQVAIDDAAAQLDAVTWDNLYDQGVKWLAAHLLALSHPELSQTPGSKVRLWETPGAQDAGMLGTTRFGVQFTSLRASIITSPLVI